MKHSNMLVLAYVLDSKELEKDTVTRAIHRQIMLPAIPRLRDWSHVHVFDCNFPRIKEMDKQIFYSRTCSKFQNAKRDPTIIGFRVSPRRIN